MRRYRLPTLITELVMVAVGVLFAAPLYILAVLSLKTPQETATSPLSIPWPINAANYVDAWTQAKLGPAMLVSLLVTTVSITLLVLMSSFAAYALVRRTGRLTGFLFGLFLIGMMVPTQLGLISLYQLMRDMGLLGSPLSLMLFEVGHQMPLSIFLYSSFLRALPPDYEEAAMIDGADRVRAFLSVVFPLMRPVTGTVIILNAISIWNAFLVPLLYVGGSSWQTVPLAVFSFVSDFDTRWNVVFAGLVIAMAPILIAYFILQKRMIQGFVSGLKG
jgi:raffinose/stachyose/melibiose transport system permease protein